MNLLLVEDDDAIASPLVMGLEREGFRVERAATAQAALAAPPADFVLLDLGLPDADGLEVCRTLRARGDTPIIVITARADEIDRVVLLELGADDYMVKPFGLRELVARIRAVARRSQPRDPAPVGTAPGGAAVGIGPLAIDRRTRRVTLHGDDRTLTPKEYDLLTLLATDPGAVFDRQAILETVWDTHWYGPTKTLDVHVAALRKKLGDPRWIETVRGVGFRLVDPDAPTENS